VPARARFSPSRELTSKRAKRGCGIRGKQSEITKSHPTRPVSLPQAPRRLAPQTPLLLAEAARHCQPARVPFLVPEPSLCRNTVKPPSRGSHWHLRPSQARRAASARVRPKCELEVNRRVRSVSPRYPDCKSPERLGGRLSRLLLRSTAKDDAGALTPQRMKK
jgi:hypothetical protein